MSLTLTPCDLCGSSKFLPVYPSSIAPEGDPAAYYSSSRTKTGHLEIVRCQDCGLVMTNPRDDDATLKRVYSNLIDKQYTKESVNRRLTARDHFALVAQHHPSPAALLDIGCATGLFVCEAQNAGWQATGLEASPWAISMARKGCPQAKFISGALETTHFEAGNFQVITLWDVLEHVRSPSETMTRVHAWLKPDGLLLLNLPDFSSPVARLMGRYWVLLLREHIWYFTPATMHVLLEKTGFSLLNVSTNYVHFSLANIFSRLAQYPGPFGTLAAKISRFETLKSLTLRFPIGEMSIVARKTVHKACQSIAK